MFDEKTHEAYNSNYRGIVVDNYDPKNLGRCKIFVPGIYPSDFADTPEVLPWSNPIMQPFGGSYKNDGKQLNKETGVTSVPHAGAIMWVFFERGDWNYPFYWAADQSGEGWLSETNNQHVIQTDNVTVIIDETPIPGKFGKTKSSTIKYDSYNLSGTTLSKNGHHKENIPARVDIKIALNSGIAVNLDLSGDVNMKVVGDVYEEIKGNRHETIEGNLYRKHVGDIQYIHEGVTIEEHEGDVFTTIKGNKTESIQGQLSQHAHQSADISIGGSLTFSAPTAGIDLVTGGCDGGGPTKLGISSSLLVDLKNITSVIHKDESILVKGSSTKTATGNIELKTGDTLNIQASNNIINGAGKSIGNTAGISIQNTSILGGIYNESAGIISNKSLVGGIFNEATAGGIFTSTKAGIISLSNTLGNVSISTVAGITSIGSTAASITMNPATIDMKSSPIMNSPKSAPPAPEIT